MFEYFVIMAYFTYVLRTYNGPQAKAWASAAGRGLFPIAYSIWCRRRTGRSQKVPPETPTDAAPEHRKHMMTPIWNRFGRRRLWRYNEKPGTQDNVRLDIVLFRRQSAPRDSKRTEYRWPCQAWASDAIGRLQRRRAAEPRRPQSNMSRTCSRCRSHIS